MAPRRPFAPPGPGGSGETVSTGIPELDHTLNSALSVERIELAGLTGYQSIGCVEAPEGAASPPVCREGEAPGDEVEAFPVLQCELAWVRPELMTETYAQALGDAPDLVAVYRPVQQPAVLESDYIGVFATNGDDGDRNGVALSVLAGRVIQIEYACNGFESLYAADKVEEFIVPPEGVEATPTAASEGEPPAEDAPAE